MIIKIFDKIILTTLFFITLFPIYFSILPTVAWQVIYSIIPLIYLLIYCPYNHLFKYMMKNNSWYTSMMLLLAGVIYALLLTGFISGEYSYFEKMVLLFRGIAQFMAIGVFIKRNFNEDALVIFSKYYAYTAVIYVLCSCVFLFDLSLRSTWMLLINENSNSTHAMNLVEQAGEYITRFGLIGYSGFGCTMICSLGVLLWICFCKRIDFKISVPVLMILLLGNMFYGRSGLILSMLLLAIYQLRNGEWKIIIKAVFYMVPILIIVSSIFTEFVEGNNIEHWFNWVLNPINGLIEGWGSGTLSLGSSGDVMLNMYYMPDSDWTIILGDGKYKNSDGSYYGNTDVGIMRMMLFGGMVNVMCFYGSLLSLLLSLYKPQDNEKRIVFYMSMITCVFFEIKGDALHQYYGVFFALIYIASSKNIFKIKE